MCYTPHYCETSHAGRSRCPCAVRFSSCSDTPAPSNRHPMKVRTSFAAAFLVLCALSAYLGFADIHLGYDKALHAITFFVLTLVFYWTIDSSRKRSINVAFLVCTLFLGVGSEFAQNFSPYREFDVNDIVYNVAGSISAIALSAWYHKRLLSRKRTAKYQALHQSETPHQLLGQAPESIDLEAQTTAAGPSLLRTQSARDDDDNASAITLQEVAPEPVSASNAAPQQTQLK